jgi:hypothetical protein
MAFFPDQTLPIGGALCLHVPVTLIDITQTCHQKDHYHHIEDGG